MLSIPADADHKELGVQNHFSFGVRNVHEAATQLRINGLQTFDGPEVGRDGKDSLDAYDPDGTRVEVMEFTAKEKPCCHPYSAEHPKAEELPELNEALNPMDIDESPRFVPESNYSCVIAEHSSPSSRSFRSSSF